MSREAAWDKLLREKFLITDQNLLYRLIYIFFKDLELLETLQSFNFNLYEDNIINMLKDFENYFRKHRTFVFTGVVGSGKTYLMNYIRFLITGTLKSKSLSKKYIDSSRWRHLANDFENRGMLDMYKKRNIVFIDDLGIRAQERYKDIIEDFLLYRLNKPNMWTFVTTNLNRYALTEFIGERVVSRLFHRSHSVSYQTGNQDLRKVAI